MTLPSFDSEFQAYADGRFEFRRTLLDGSTLGIMAERVRIERNRLYAKLRAYQAFPHQEGRRTILEVHDFDISDAEKRRKFGRDIHEQLPDLVKGTKDEPAYGSKDIYHDLVVFEERISQSMTRVVSRSLGEIAPVREVNWLFYPLVIEKQPVFLFGDGGGGKSLVALALSMSLQTGQRVLPGLTPMRPRNVLYLNWETDDDEIRMRQINLTGQHNLPGVEAIRHITCFASLQSMVTDLMLVIHEWEIGLIIVDSLLLAAGGSDEDVAQTFFTALRRLGVASLVVAHTQKNAEQKSVFGSVFFTNLARNVFEVRGKAEGDSLTVALYHRKGNNLRRLAPMAWRLHFSPEITIEAASVMQDADLVKGVSVSQQVEAIIKAARKPVSRDDLLTELAALNPDVEAARLANNLRLILHRQRGRSLVAVVDQNRPNEELWALKAPDRG